MPYTNYELPASDDAGLIVLSNEGVISTDSMNAGIVTQQDGELLGLAFSTPTTEFTAAFDYDDGQVQGILYTVANNVGDTLFISVGPEDCTTTSSCVMEEALASAASVIELDCYGKFLEAAGRFVNAAAKTVVLVAVVTPPGKVAGVIGKLATAVPKLEKAAVAAYKGAQALKGPLAGVARGVLGISAFFDAKDAWVDFAQVAHKYNTDCPYGN